VSSERTARSLTVFDVWGPNRQRAPGVPRLLRQSVRLAWTAGPDEVATIAVVQLLSVAGVTAQVLIARALLAHVLRAGRAGATLAALTAPVIALAAITAVLGVTQAIAANRQRVLAERCSHYGENGVLAVVATAPLAAFDDPGFHDRVARARVAVQRLPAVIAGLAALGRALASSLGALIALVAMAPLFAGLLVLVSIPAWLAARVRARAFHRLAIGFTPLDRERQYVADLIVDRDAAKELRAFGVHGHLRERHDRLWRQRIEMVRAVAGRQLALTVAAELAGGVLIGLTLVLLVALVVDHRLSLAGAGASAAAVVLLGQRLAFAGASAGGLSESALFLRDYLDLVALGQAAQPPPPLAPPSELHVRAQRVSFRYGGAREPALSDITLEIAPGEVVALVGENGSGKTTLAKLLAGLYDPEHGTVSWNGVALGDGEAEQRRGAVAVIFQDFLCYALSAAENIGLGAVARLGDREAIARAAALAGVDGAIDQLPAGYDTLLAPAFLDGTDMSLGQWQRIAIARALFRDAPFVILDEPTASLDAHAEHELFERIRELMAGRTVLLISHRLSSARIANRIIVLDHGRVVEQGTHNELIAGGGRYAQMFALQAGPYR